MSVKELTEQYVKPVIDKLQEATSNTDVSDQERAAIRNEIADLLRYLPVMTIIELNKLLPENSQLSFRRQDIATQVQEALELLFARTEVHIRVQTVAGTLVDTATMQRGDDGDGEERMRKPSPETEGRLLLIEEMLTEMGVDIAAMPKASAEGTIPPNATRSLPYMLIRIPSLDRSILLCEQTENITLILYTADEEEIDREYAGRGKDDLKEDLRVLPIRWRGKKVRIKKRLIEALQLAEAPREIDYLTGRIDGTVTLQDPETGEGREAIGVSRYAGGMEMPVASLKRIVNKSKVKPTGIKVRFPLHEGERKNNTTISRPVDTYWKDKVDLAIPLPLDKDGVGIYEEERGKGERVIGINAFSKKYHCNTMTMYELIKLTKIERIPRSGRYGTILYKEKELLAALARSDELLGIRRTDKKGFVKVQVEGAEGETEAFAIQILASFLRKNNQTKGVSVDRFTKLLKAALEAKGIGRLENLSHPVHATAKRSDLQAIYPKEGVVRVLREDFEVTLEL